MDGTLLRSTAAVELARQRGMVESGLAIEKRWGDGLITAVEFWERLLLIWRDASAADLEAAFSRAPWMEGIVETFADIDARGESAIVISQSPAFFVRGLESWGAEETFGSAVEPGLVVDESSTLMPQTKVTIATAALAARGLGADDCVVYGDSWSDVDLFRSFRHSVGVNPTAHLAALAAVTYVGGDLRAAYRMGRGLLDSSDHHPSAQGSSRT